MRDSKHRTERVAGGVLAECGFTENNRARFLDAIDYEGVAYRTIVLEHKRTQCCRHAGRINLILHKHWNPVKRATHSGPLEGCIEPVGIFKRLRVQRDDAVECRAMLVKCAYAIQIRLNELSRAQLSRSHCGVNIVYGCLDDREPVPIVLAVTHQ